MRISDWSSDRVLFRSRFVEHLNGQFAIALWDGASRRLVLARDRVGIRPPYWTKADGTLWFASEPKALFAALPGRAQLSVRGLLQAFSYWAPLDPDNAWEGVHSLTPGHVLAIEADGREPLVRYWDWTFPDAADTLPARFRRLEPAVGELRGRRGDPVGLDVPPTDPAGTWRERGRGPLGVVAAG